MNTNACVVFNCCKTDSFCTLLQESGIPSDLCSLLQVVPRCVLLTMTREVHTSGESCDMVGAVFTLDAGCNPASCLGLPAE
jgi:hypothetical protein